MKKVDEFSKEKLEELAEFGKKGCPDVMLEVVKEVAHRISFHSPTQDIQEVETERLIQELLVALRKRVKITVVVEEGWDPVL